MKRITLSFILGTLLLVFLPLTSSAQSTTSPQGMHLPPLAEQSQGMGVPVKTEEQINQERLQKYRELRQQEIRRDTEKLYQLSGELKEYMDKSSSSVLSLDMLKKAETIEKLAHGVRQKMKDFQ